MTISSRVFALAVGFGVVLAAPSVSASGGGGGGGAGSSDSSISSSSMMNPDFSRALEAVEAKDWDKAMESLKKALARDEHNADVYNYLGYVERYRGNFDASFKYYEKALAINPKHRGAHEYVGEAYLMTNNLAKAEDHLAALDKICTFGCDEYTDLKNRIAQYKTDQKK